MIQLPVKASAPSLKQIFLALILISFCSFAQLPKENVKLNSTTVYFESNFFFGAGTYEFEITALSENPGPPLLYTMTRPAALVEGLRWNTKYSWRMRAFDKNGQELDAGTVQYFEIGKKIYSVNEDDTKLKININDSTKHHNELVILDYARGIFTRGGAQVWALPEIPGLVSEKRQIRDMKLSYDHTITFLGGNVPTEIDFEGNVLWSAPNPFIFNKDTITYHHDFRKLKNGNYMVLGHRKAPRRVFGSYKDSTLKIDFNMVYRNDTLYKRTLQSVLLEFDSKGNLVWYWDSNSYITDDDLNYKKLETSLPSFGTHANAFSVSDDNKKIYVGFRDLSRIVRINKATKKVEYSFGERYPSGDAKVGNGLFTGQHDASITKRGTILVLNNNNDQKGGNKIGSVLEIKDVSSDKEDLLLFKFDLNFDTLTDGKSSAAGNIVEVPNSNLLVCGGIMPRLFEVTKEKKIVWDAFVYGRTPANQQWNLFPQYRIGYTSQLYFYHFLIEKDLGTVGANYKLNIYNTGNATDSYEATLYNKAGKVLAAQKTKDIAAGSDANVQFTAASVKAAGNYIVVKSKHQKIYSKRIDF